MRTYTFKLYRSKRNKHLHRKINITGMIYNHLIALHRRHYRLFGKGISANRAKLHITGSSSFSVELMYIGINSTPNDERDYERKRYHCVRSWVVRSVGDHCSNVGYGKDAP